MAKTKIRPIGIIYCELEKKYDEMVDSHDVQVGDILSWTYQHLKMHRPDALEEFEADNTNPVFFYGHEDELIRLAAKIIKRRKNEKKNI
jgi:hypothetical protein